jgi:hypothetical protein
MKILKEGDKERAWHPDLGKVVEVVYKRQAVFLQAEDVEVLTLVGVHEETGEALLLPPQATPDIAAAIKAKASSAATIAVTSATTNASAIV